MSCIEIGFCYADRLANISVSHTIMTIVVNLLTESVHSFETVT